MWKCRKIMYFGHATAWSGQCLARGANVACKTKGQGPKHLSEILRILKWQSCLSTSWSPIKCLFIIKQVVPVPFTWHIQTVRINTDRLNLHDFRYFLFNYFFFKFTQNGDLAFSLAPSPPSVLQWDFEMNEILPLDLWWQEVLEITLRIPGWIAKWISNMLNVCL